MNGKRTLLVITLILALGAVALAQGLVGAPVDPRYGQGDPNDPPPPPPSGSKATAQRSQSQSAAAKLSDAVLALLLATRL